VIAGRGRGAERRCKRLRSRRMARWIGSPFSPGHKAGADAALRPAEVVAGRVRARCRFGDQAHVERSRVAL